MLWLREDLESHPADVLPWNRLLPILIFPSIAASGELSYFQRGERPLPQSLLNEIKRDTGIIQWNPIQQLFFFLEILKEVIFFDTNITFFQIPKETPGIYIFLNKYKC